MKKIEIAIIGAGLSGLTSALKIQNLGKEYLLIDKSNRVGGRVGSTYEKGFIYDHGFQVYNTAYKFGSEILDYDKLNFQKFKPGVSIYYDSKFNIISDPLRDVTQIFNTFFSKISNFSDKLKILKLKYELNKYDLYYDNNSDSSTIEYLKEYGFSKNIIENFFRPFFAGIFLEKKLITSAKFFKFVFSKLGSGDVCLPKKGMQKIPDQIFQKLHSQNILLNTNIKSINDNILTTDKGDTFRANKIILTSNSQNIVTKSNLMYNRVLCFYFVSNNQVKNSKYIYLFPQEEYINNIAILSSISREYCLVGKTFFSVTILGFNGSPKNMIKLIQNKLSVFFGERAGDYKFLKYFNILKGTMKQSSFYKFKNSNQTNGYIISGEQTTNGSIDGAIESGIIAANKVKN